MSPNLKIDIARQDEETLGELFYFFEFACGVSGYVLGVNPFNQPGVESYKKNMFALLGKPGYEKEREETVKETVTGSHRTAGGVAKKAAMLPFCGTPLFLCQRSVAILVKRC